MTLNTKTSWELLEYVWKLEEENKNLTKCNLNLQEHIDKVEEENKNLKEKLEKWEKDYREWIIVHARNG